VGPSKEAGGRPGGGPRPLGRSALPITFRVSRPWVGKINVSERKIAHPLNGYLITIEWHQIGDWAFASATKPPKSNPPGASPETRP